MVRTIPTSVITTATTSIGSIQLVRDVSDCWRRNECAIYSAERSAGDYGAESDCLRQAGSVRPLPFTWPYALFFWAVYVWAFFPEWRVVQGGIKGSKDVASKDSGSLRV